jgi:hypothetical protein
MMPMYAFVHQFHWRLFTLNPFRISRWHNYILNRVGVSVHFGFIAVL